ncbi:hypothetical protein FF2_023861 [Malus domestica]
MRRRKGGFDEWREGVAVWRGLVGKHVDEEEEGLAGLAETEMGSDRSVVEEGWHPFGSGGFRVLVVEEMTVGD